MADVRSGAEALPQVPRVAMSAEAIATDINRQGTAIGNTQVAQNRSLPPEEWTGAAADAASSEIQKLGEKTVTLSEAFSPAATALNEWGSAVNSAISDVTGMQNEWDTAVHDYNKAIEEADAAYEAHGSPLDAQLYGGGSDWYSDPNGGWGSRSHDRSVAYNNASAALTAAQDDIRARYVERLNKLDDSAQTAANSINSARQGIVSDEVGSQGRDAIGANLFGSDTPILSGAEQWAHAQKIAQEMADDLKKEPKTAEDVKNFNDKYGDYLQNPYYATALMQHVSLDEIYAATLDVSLNVNGKSSNPADPGFVFNKNLGAVLALATGGSNLDSGMVDSQKSFDLISKALVGKDGASVPGTIQKTLDALKETGRKEYTFPGLPEGAEPVYGYDISSQLMGLAGRENTSLTLGAGFYRDPLDPVPDPNNPNDPRHNYPRVKSVFEDMVEWDHETKAGERATSGYSGSAWSVNMVPYQAGNREHLGHLDPLQNIFTLSDTPDYLASSKDVVLQGVEDKRLLALRHVLNSETGFDVTADFDGDKATETQPMNMARYLTGWRGLAAESGLGYGDHGEALGDMLNDASARTSAPLGVPNPDDLEKYPLGDKDPAYLSDKEAFESWQRDDKTRAQIAQNSLVGYLDGLGHSEETLLGEDTFGHDNSNLRWWVGKVAAGRADDLAAIAQEIGGGTLDTQNSTGNHGYSMMNLTEQQAKQIFTDKGLLTDLASDQPSKTGSTRPPALQALSDAAWKGYRTDLQLFAQEEYDTATSGSAWRDKLKNGVSGWSRLIAGVDKAPAKAGITLDDAIIERNKETRAMIDYGISKIALSKIPYGDLLSVPVDTLMEKYYYDERYPTGRSQAVLTQQIQKDLASTQEFQDAAVSAFLAREDWPNADGLSKEELLRGFARSNPTLGFDPNAGKGYADMSEQQREALRTYLTTTETGASHKRTDLALLEGDMARSRTEAEEFLRNVNL